MEKIKASLVVEYADGKSEKLKMKDAKGNVYEEISLATLDYMLSSYSSLERYLELALEANYISSKEATLKIFGNDGNMYPLPFETNYNGIIYKCSESACYKGNGMYIEKGDDVQTVSNMEFQDFFQDFISNILNDVGYQLLNEGYFSNFPNFDVLLKHYYVLSQKEDDMYVAFQTNRMEKDFSSIRNPRTIDDYLRNYNIFRRAVSFNLLCIEKRNEKIRPKEEVIKKEDDKEFSTEKILKPFYEKREASYYARKRSLCYIVGNNCEPLILKTMDADDLDHFIVENYHDPKAIRKEYREQIEAYVYKHKEYVAAIRNQINNHRYSGQLSILAHDSEGRFIRTGEGIYLRYPIIYSNAFSSVKSLYCNIDRFRKEAVKLRKKLDGVETKLAVQTTIAKHERVEESFRKVLEELEQEQKVTKEQLESTISEIKKIVEDMKELEEFDYNRSLENSNYKRFFSKQVSNTVRFVEGTIPQPSYKKILDSWLVSISNSSLTDYDQVRIILRELRRKINIREYEFPIIDKPDSYKVDRIDSAHIIEPVSPNDEDIVEKEEAFLSEDELIQMYGEIPSDEILRKENIRVYR